MTRQVGMTNCWHVTATAPALIASQRSQPTGIACGALVALRRAEAGRGRGAKRGQHGRRGEWDAPAAATRSEARSSRQSSHLRVPGMSVRTDREDQAQILDGRQRWGSNICSSCGRSRTAVAPELALDHDPAPRISWAGCASCISGAPPSLSQSAYEAVPPPCERINSSGIGICSAEEVAGGPNRQTTLAQTNSTTRSTRACFCAAIFLRKPVTWTSCFTEGPLRACFCLT